MNTGVLLQITVQEQQHLLKTVAMSKVKRPLKVRRRRRRNMRHSSSTLGRSMRRIMRRNMRQTSSTLGGIR